MVSKVPEPLPVERLGRRCDPKVLARAAAAKGGESGLVGQERGLSALRLAVEIRHNDFNLFVLGPQGTGRRTAVENILRKHASTRKPSEDWVYVNNFDDPHKPVVLGLPPGAADKLRDEMARVVDDLANDIPALFESEEYQTQRRAIDEEFGERQEQAMADFTSRARAEDIALIRTPMGFMVAATRNGEVVKTEDFKKLPEAEQDVIEEKIARFQAELSEVLSNGPKLEREHRIRIEALNAEMAGRVVSSRIDEAREVLGDTKVVADFLTRVHDDMIENPELFLQAAAQKSNGPFPEALGKAHLEPVFRRYMVNVMVAHSADAKGVAPVVVEDLPTFDRLVGRIEHISQMGSLVTDFTLIRPGALHRANGGYLVLDARRVLSEPYAWDALKRSIKERAIKITSLAERMSLFSTTSLEPDSIPLDVRVVLVGDRFLHELLVMLDPDFQELFKVQADFEESVVRNDETLAGMSLLLRHYAEKEELLPLADDALARLLDEATRIAEDATKLSLRLSPVTDILREAEHYARAESVAEVRRQDIERAVEEQDRRASRVRDRVQESIARRTVMIDTEGRKVGQINGLSVHEMGGFRFGRPSRITARVRMGTGKLIDIEREVELGGPLHSKGVMILSGYLTSTYALDVPFSLHASLVFEQSYGGIEGDSASCAELVALLSALSQKDVRQDMAMTGSVNQLGEVQAIGGVNEKIEGFFDICAERGLTGAQAVIIPAANVDHLMLRDRVMEAVAAGRFGIIPVSTVDEAVELLTGVPAGKRGADGNFPDGSVNKLVEARLREFAQVRKSFASRGPAPEAGEHT
ncbi:Lon protease family protein [Silicimonas sp. MF1-12-2]|uniref:Lon protease family protein n=1 Tax=Silicimonas sp. MF1-12-2 TaxID=3384793 RepID=UPI0039B5051D